MTDEERCSYVVRILAIVVEAPEEERETILRVALNTVGGLEAMQRTFERELKTGRRGLRVVTEKHTTRKSKAKAKRGAS